MSQTGSGVDVPRRAHARHPQVSDPTRVTTNNFLSPIHSCQQVQSVKQSLIGESVHVSSIAAHRFQDVTEDDRTTLKIYKALLTDAGEYQCVLQNKFGKATFSIKVLVLDKPGPPRNLKVRVVDVNFNLRHTNAHTLTHTETHMNTQTQRNTDRHTDRHTHTHKCTHTEFGLCDNYQPVGCARFCKALRTQCWVVFSAGDGHHGEDHLAQVDGARDGRRQRHHELHRRGARHDALHLEQGQPHLTLTFSWVNDNSARTMRAHMQALKFSVFSHVFAAPKHKTHPNFHLALKLHKNSAPVSLLVLRSNLFINF